MSAESNKDDESSASEFMWRSELTPEEIVSIATSLHSGITKFLRDVESLTEPVADVGIRVEPKLVKGKLKLESKEFNEPWKKGNRRIVLQAAADALCNSYKALGKAANKAMEAGGKYRFTENNLMYERERIPDHEQRLFVYGINPMRAIGEAPFASQAETMRRNAKRFRPDDIITNKTIEVLRQTATGLKDFTKDVSKVLIPSASKQTQTPAANLRGTRTRSIHTNKSKPLPATATRIASRNPNITKTKDDKFRLRKVDEQILAIVESSKGISAEEIVRKLPKKRGGVAYEMSYIYNRLAILKRASLIDHDQNGYRILSGASDRLRNEKVKSK